MKHNGRDSGSGVENECAERVDKQKDFKRICAPLFMTRVSWQNFGFSTCIGGREKRHKQTEDETEFFIRYSDNVVDVLKMQTQGANFCWTPSQVTWKLNFEVSSPLKASCISHATPYAKNMFKFIKKKRETTVLLFCITGGSTQKHFLHDYC